MRPSTAKQRTHAVGRFALLKKICVCVCVHVHARARVRVCMCVCVCGREMLYEGIKSRGCAIDRVTDLVAPAPHKTQQPHIRIHIHTYIYIMCIICNTYIYMYIHIHIYISRKKSEMMIESTNHCHHTTALSSYTHTTRTTRENTLACY